MSLSGRVRVCLSAGVTGLLIVAIFVFSSNMAFATGQLTSRSLTLQAGVSAGGSEEGGVVNHLFSFTTATTANIGSIQFLYCTNADGTCTTPTGLDTTAATMGTESGATSFTLVNTTNGAPYITRSAANINSGVALSYQLLSVTNPSTIGSFYVRISTFTSTNATGTPVDSGNVAASTASQITLSGTMPESLVFCTGGTISTTASIPDCSTATSGAISFNQLFSPTAAATATSQLSASTNAINGYVITVNGTTLTSGSNTITNLTTAQAPAVGNSEFGMNLVANSLASSNPAVGTAVAPAANGTTLKGQPVTGYGTADEFQYNSGDTIAQSNNGGNGPTNPQIYTVSYLVNVDGAQVAGTYTTTLTYICTPTF